MKNENDYDELFKKYAKGIDWLLLKAQVKQESGFNKNAMSPVGALGLAQFMKGTWLEWADGTPGIQITKMIYDRKNPEHSIRAQSAYMNWLLKQFNGNINHALGAYNWGIGNMKRCLDKYGSLYFTKIPSETQTYIANILRFYSEYKKETT